MRCAPGHLAQRYSHDWLVDLIFVAVEWVSLLLEQRDRGVVLGGECGRAHCVQRFHELANANASHSYPKFVDLRAHCHARDCQAPEGETISDLSDGALASISTETEVDRDGHDAVWTNR